MNLAAKLLLPCLLVLGGCSAPEEPAPSADLRDRFKLQLAGQPAYPADNPKNKDRFVLGWRVFYDPILSATRDVACGTCHHARFAMSDGRRLSLGVHAHGLGPNRKPGGMTHETPRHSPSIINIGYVLDAQGHSPMFWDGRARNLEEQSLFPIRDPHEMLGHEIDPRFAIDSVIARLRAIKLYEIYFTDAFDQERDSVARGLLTSTITASTLARALASFQREVVSVDSKFDKYVRRELELSSEEMQGLEIFFGKANCGSCHNGPMLSDFRMYGQGIGSLNDEGAGNYRFKTPSLRNLELTAPYMHDGSIATIDDVIEYYDRGIAQNPQLPKNSIDQRFKPLGLSSTEKKALKAFLLTLRDDGWQDFVVPPSVVPSNLDVPR